MSDAILLIPLLIDNARTVARVEETMIPNK